MCLYYLRKMLYYINNFRTNTGAVMEFVYQGAIGQVNISEAELYVDNKSRKRSGHMSHAMVEYAPGKIIAFNSNCSAVRYEGHSAFGWMEYRYSEDGGKTWSEIFEMDCSKDILHDGIYSISVEKAVFNDGVITCFAVRNTQSGAICCEPWDTPLVIQSYDLGKTWDTPYEFSIYPGRIYDAKAYNGVIYAVETCDKDFLSEIKENRFRLFVSRDNGKSFQEESVIDMESYKRGYAALQFRADGALLAYSCDLLESYFIEASISYDLGKTWKCLPHIRLKHGIRNIQIAPLGKGFVMHGRAWLNESWGMGQVVYSSLDGVNWDDGLILNHQKTGCYYSNMQPVSCADGKNHVLLQYSDTYADDSRVNVMHRFLTVD